ncbi:MAG: MCE family protein [Candidatus Dadabacteria bacterium]|nr:MAG: MCE family protein [Candidatus Dadabacteria bacterium]
MNESTTKTFSVGLVALVALTIIAVGVFLVGREQRFWEGRTTYWLQFSRTNGLQEGAPVALDGVNVGWVSRMQFPPDPTARYVEVKISVSSSVAPRIRRDTVGKIQTLGLLGDKYIELTSGTLEAEPVEPGGLIRSVDPVDYEAILGQSGDIVSNAIEVTALLRQVLTDINQGEGLIGRLISDRDFGRQFADDLSLTIANIESATRRVDELFARVQAGEGTLGTLMQSEEQIATILDNLEIASEQAARFASKLNSGQGTLARLASDEEFADKTLSNIERASASIAEIAEKVRSGQGTLGKLVNDETLYNRAESLLGGGGGGFWKLLGRTIAFFLPWSSGNESGTRRPALAPAGAHPSAPAMSPAAGAGAGHGRFRRPRR